MSLRLHTLPSFTKLPQRKILLYLSKKLELTNIQKNVEIKKAKDFKELTP